MNTNRENTGITALMLMALTLLFAALILWKVSPLVQKTMRLSVGMAVGCIITWAFYTGLKFLWQEWRNG